MLRLNTSILDMFCAMRSGRPWATPEEFEKRLKGKRDKMTETQEFGIAFHDSMDRPRSVEFRNGIAHLNPRYTRPFQVSMADWLTLANHVHDGFTEVKYGLRYIELDCLVICKLDRVWGLQCDDWKCTLGLRMQDPVRLHQSVQWRVALLASGCDRFVYRATQWRNRRRKRDKAQFKVLRNYAEFSCWRYRGLRHDVARIVRDCSAYIRASNLAGYVDQHLFAANHPNVQPHHEIVTSE